MVSVPLVCSNNNTRIDPLRFPCDLGRFADGVFRLYDRLVLVSEGMRELVGLVHWLGPTRCSQLIQSGVLKFALLQHQPAVWRRQDAGNYGIIQALPPTPHHPDPNDGWLRTHAELSHYLRSMFRDGEYLPEGWCASDDVADHITSATTILDPTLSRTAVELVVKICRSNRIDAVAARFRSALGRPTSISPGIRLEGANTIVVIQENENTMQDLNGLVDCGVELVVSAALVSEHSTSPSGAALLSEISRRSMSRGSDRESSFHEICALEGVPRFQDVVFTGELGADAIVRLREDPEAQRFRAWLTVSQASAQDGQSLLRAYYRSINKVFVKESLPLSVLRLVGTLGMSCVQPVAGVAASVLDWLFGRLCRPLSGRRRFSLMRHLDR